MRKTIQLTKKLEITLGKVAGQPTISTCNFTYGEIVLTHRGGVRGGRKELRRTTDETKSKTGKGH